MKDIQFRAIVHPTPEYTVRPNAARRGSGGKSTTEADSSMGSIRSGSEGVAAFGWGTVGAFSGAGRGERGQHSQSIEPARPTKAAVFQTPMSASSSIGCA